MKGKCPLKGLSQSQAFMADFAVFSKKASFKPNSIISIFADSSAHHHHHHHSH